jgi:hypothetical protein
MLGEGTSEEVNFFLEMVLDGRRGPMKPLGVLEAKRKRAAKVRAVIMF